MTASSIVSSLGLDFSCSTASAASSRGTGWRVIDKKRDTSPAGRYAGVDGRQADRRKIARAPEDVIRVKVIAEPMVSEEDFRAVQRIMDLKQAKHWRTQPDIEHRFTYNGFLTCSACGEVVHTAYARRDYYACKGRRTGHTCTTKYMGREKLESRLDSLFGAHLTSLAFLERCVSELKRRPAQDDPAAHVQRLTAQVSRFREKRTRIVDAFLEGIIRREERDSRLAAVDRDIRAAQEILMRSSTAALVDLNVLIEAFAPLMEWQYWSREQKRSVLATIAPDIRVADYQIVALGLSPTIFSNENIRKDTDSWPRPA
jgi:hypothetical protein